MAQDNAQSNRPVGSPSEKSVVKKIEFTAPRPSVSGATPATGIPNTYTILRTTETDGYEPDLAPAAVPDFGAAPPAPPRDDFRGTARRRAKTSIARATVEDFADLSDLIDSLPGHAEMVALGIPTHANSGRVAKERRNVRLRAFLYAASREDDNDYHLIIGRDPAATPPLYMTIEISGLPPPASTHHGQLSTTRSAYKGFFGANLPGTSYDFYRPPVPVDIEGSLFFDASHATGSRPGPSSLRGDMPVVWELHPVSSIELEP